ncbi:MAG: hypothetical protein AAFS02_09925 [Pseudomonadota bacterium]
MSMSRRRLIKWAGGAAGVVAAMAAGGAAWLSARMRETEHNYSYPETAGLLEPTPACEDSAPTLAQTEGPFYTPDTPKRANLRDPEMAGQTLFITGRILTTDCRPVAGAVIDVWSCDAKGVYDNEGFTLRGHQFTDEQGRFRIGTIKPAAYTDFGITRTPHIHVKLQGPGTALLTTQLYFPGEAGNADDSIYDERLLMSMTELEDGGLVGEFDFVLASATARA